MCVHFILLDENQNTQFECDNRQYNQVKMPLLSHGDSGLFKLVYKSFLATCFQFFKLSYILFNYCRCLSNSTSVFPNLLSLNIYICFTAINLNISC